MTDTEDDPLIERLARAACWAEGHDPNETFEEFIDAHATEGKTVRKVEVPAWKRYQGLAEVFLAMQRELERARGEADQCDHRARYLWRQIRTSTDDVIYQCDKCGKVTEEPDQ